MAGHKNVHVISVNYVTEYNIARKMLFTRWALFPFAGRVRTLRRILDLENGGDPPVLKCTIMYDPLANLARCRPIKTTF